MLVSFYCRRIWTSESLLLNHHFARGDVSTVSGKNKLLTFSIVSPNYRYMCFKISYYYCLPEVFHDDVGIWYVYHLSSEPCLTSQLHQVLALVSTLTD